MNSSESSPDYTAVTETPGTLVSREAASMALSLLKRMFLGPLLRMPAELSPDSAPIDQPLTASLDYSLWFRNIYAVSRL